MVPNIEVGEVKELRLWENRLLSLSMDNLFQEKESAGLAGSFSFRSFFIGVNV